MKNKRSGTRIPLQTRATVRYEAGSEQRTVEFPVKDLDANAVSLTIPADDPVNQDFHHIFGKQVSIEFFSDEFRSRDRLTAFLYRIERLRSGYARWVFFFNQKIDPERFVHQNRDG